MYSRGARQFLASGAPHRPNGPADCSPDPIAEPYVTHHRQRPGPLSEPSVTNQALQRRLRAARIDSSQTIHLRTRAARIDSSQTIHLRTRTARIDSSQTIHLRTRTNVGIPVVVPGTAAKGPRVMGQVQLPESHGSRLTAHGSRLTAVVPRRDEDHPSAAPGRTTGPHDCARRSSASPLHWPALDALTQWFWRWR